MKKLEKWATGIILGYIAVALVFKFSGGMSWSEAFILGIEIAKLGK